MRVDVEHMHVTVADTATCRRELSEQTIKLKLIAGTEGGKGGGLGSPGLRTGSEPGPA